MFLRHSTHSIRHILRASSLSFQYLPSSPALSIATGTFEPHRIDLNSLVSCRKLSTSDENVRTVITGNYDLQVEKMLDMIEQSREEGNMDQELKQSLHLYDVLQQRKKQGVNVFEVAFGIARIYDEELKDGQTAITYYRDALAVLDATSIEETVEGVYMRVTTLGALAMCHENLGQVEDAENCFYDAISVHEKHFDQASEVDVPDSDVLTLNNLNATAAMIHYHFAANLLAQERWDEAKHVTKIALVLAENSSMPTDELEKLQHCVHELWLELE